MMKSVPRALTFWALLSLMFYQSVRVGTDPTVAKVFGDFDLVATAKAELNPDGSLHPTHPPAHGNVALRKPEALEKGVLYIFHQHGYTNAEELALQVFPKRLREIGFRIVKAPKSADDLLYSYVGGPFFTIEFSDGHREGLIFNSLENPDSKADYILVFLR